MLREFLLFVAIGAGAGILLSAYAITRPSVEQGQRVVLPTRGTGGSAASFVVEAVDGRNILCISWASANARVATFTCDFDHPLDDRQMDRVLGAQK
jgi:hypothetical protein